MEHLEPIGSHQHIIIHVVGSPLTGLLCETLLSQANLTTGSLILSTDDVSIRLNGQPFSPDTRRRLSSLPEKSQMLVSMALSVFAQKKVDVIILVDVSSGDAASWNSLRTRLATAKNVVHGIASLDSKGVVEAAATKVNSMLPEENLSGIRKKKRPSQQKIYALDSTPKRAMQIFKDAIGDKATITMVSDQSSILPSNFRGRNEQRQCASLAVALFRAVIGDSIFD
jgi:hypothetical protein